MPPSPPPVETEVHVPLSDQDVGLLHQIVSRAQHDPAVERLPLRAIYSAYEVVLEENEIRATSDRNLLRFLLKLGEGGLHGESLYDKFELALEKLGISLEFDDENPPTQEVTQNLRDNQTRSLESQGDLSQQVVPDTRPRRRASFASLHNAPAYNLTKKNVRASSRSSESRLPTAASSSLQGTRQRKTASVHAKEAAQPDSSGHRASTFVAGARLTASLPRKSFHSHSRRTKSNSEIGTHGVKHEAEDENQQRHVGLQQLNFERRDVEDSTSDSISSETGGNESPQKPSPPPELLHTPSEAQLIRDADTFNGVRLRGILRDAILKWASQATELRRLHQALETRGISKDANTLKQQALELWYAALTQSRQAAKTERFYNHLYARAAKAYDLYLLTKAFTHWREIALDEIARTSVARRHILRIKYFNAWRDITVVNEMKAQRLGLKRPYNLLKRKFVQVLAAEHKAVTIYHENLTRLLYWRWFWNFCDRRAPGWGNARLKQRTLLSWIRAVRSQREREDVADFHFDQLVQRRWIRRWSQRTQAIKENQATADAVRRSRLLTTHMKAWRLESHFAPVTVRVGRIVDWRIARTTASTWLLRTRMIRRAGDVNNLRIKRDIWTVWNDGLKVRVLESRINERFVLQSMYKWVLAERSLLMERFREQRIKRASLSAFLDAYQRSKAKLLKQEQQFKTQRRERLEISSFDCWKLQMDLQQQRERTASEFHSPRIQREMLDMWLACLRQVQKTETWSRDADFYFTTKKGIKKWHNATVLSIKRRRQEAYTRMRRTVKMNLARWALQQMRSESSTLCQANLQADAKSHSKRVKTGTECFGRWRVNTLSRLSSVSEAEMEYQKNIASQSLQSWLTAFRAIQEMGDRATRFYDIHVSEVSTTQLRKLSLRTFEVRRREQDADAIKERNQRKHVKNMFRHWLSKARLLRGYPEDSDEPQEIGPELLDTAGDGTILAEDWTGLEEDLDLESWIPPLEEPLATSTPLPGYLNTPSKRAIRAKALASLSAAATPVAPLRTPFARRLRAAYSSGPSRPHVQQSIAGRSLLGHATNFERDEVQSPSQRTGGNAEPESH